MSYRLMILFVWMTAGIPAAAASCGDDKLACSEEERCCEHIVAQFVDGATAAPSYVQGRCVPKTRNCDEFWCGNQHCESGFFGRQDVCCISLSNGGSPRYSCAHSELTCPGNSRQLTIRDHTPERSLPGS